MDHAKGDRRAADHSPRTASISCSPTSRTWAKVRYKSEVHEGEHEAIVDAEVFPPGPDTAATEWPDGRRFSPQRALGTAQRTSEVAHVRVLDAAHVHREGATPLSYYVCARAQQRGWQPCPAPSIPAGEIERFVVEQIQVHWPLTRRWPKRLAAAARRHVEEAMLRLKSRTLRARTAATRRRWRGAPDSRASGTIREADLTRLADLHERMRGVEQRMSEINQEIAFLRAKWSTSARSPTATGCIRSRLGIACPARAGPLIGLLIRRVDYDGKVRGRNGHHLPDPTGFSLAERAIATGGYPNERNALPSSCDVAVQTEATADGGCGRAPTPTAANRAGVRPHLALMALADPLRSDDPVTAWWPTRPSWPSGPRDPGQDDADYGPAQFAPDIQEEILFLASTTQGREGVTERQLRPVTAVSDWRKQRRMWASMVRKGAFDLPRS